MPVPHAPYNNCDGSENQRNGRNHRLDSDVLAFANSLLGVLNGYVLWRRGQIYAIGAATVDQVARSSP